MSGKPSSDAASLDDLQVFHAVAAFGGFRGAAKALGSSSSRVSDAVRRLEDHLQVRLFDRTTRSVRLTDTGRRLVSESEDAIALLKRSLEHASAGGGTSGVLRLGAPVATGSLFLNALVASYLESHPQTSVEIQYDDRRVDPIKAGLDLMIRSEPLLEQDHYSVAVGPRVELAVVGSPAYLARVGKPASHEDLGEHDGVCFRLMQTNTRAPWIFKTDSGALTVSPRPRIVVDSMPALLHFSRAGLGLALVYRAAVLDDLARGTLVEVLAGQVAPRPRYHLSYPSNRHLSDRVRRFIDLAKASS